MITVSKSKLKAQMLKIFRQIEATGESVIVTDRDRPVLYIQPIQHGLTVEEAFGDWQGKVVWHEDPNTPTIDEWGDV